MKINKNEIVKISSQEEAGETYSYEGPVAAGKVGHRKSAQVSTQNGEIYRRDRRNPDDARQERSKKSKKREVEIAEVAGKPHKKIGRTVEKPKASKKAPQQAATVAEKNEGWTEAQLKQISEELSRTRR